MDALGAFAGIVVLAFMAICTIATIATFIEGSDPLSRGSWECTKIAALHKCDQWTRKAGER